jgi:hypothetical protein
MGMPIIPGPNNELITQSYVLPPQYAIMADSASYAATASYAIGPSKKWGSWYSTVEQTASLINTEYPITVNTLVGADGFYISGSNGSTVSGSAIVIPKTATYDFQFSLQLHNNGGGGGTSGVNIWLKVNGSNVSYSNTFVSVNNNSPYVVAAWDFMDTYDAGDKLELMWSTTNTANTIYKAAVAPPAPDTPSVIFTIMEL